MLRWLITLNEGTKPQDNKCFKYNLKLHIVWNFKLKAIVNKNSQRMVVKKGCGKTFPLQLRPRGINQQLLIKQGGSNLSTSLRAQSDIRKIRIS